MSKIKNLNNFVKVLLKNYNIKIADFSYLDQVIIHDAEEQGLEITHLELQYVKSALKTLLYKNEIERLEAIPGTKIHKQL